MGFGASLGCLATCVPVLVPYTATAEKPSIRSGLVSALLFSIGRLIAYTGLLSVFVAVKEIIPISTTGVAVATLVSGIILVLSGLAAFGIFNRPSILSRTLCQHMSSVRSPLYLGILAGIRPCGPLLAAMTFMLTLPNIAEMSIFVIFFWLVSSFLLLAIGAAGGGLALILSRRIGVDRIRRIAGVAMVVIGLFLVAQAIGLLMS
jgi:sulfite exporter TauE/SafE